MPNETNIPIAFSINPENSKWIWTLSGDGPPPGMISRGGMPGFSFWISPADQAIAGLEARIEQFKAEDLPLISHGRRILVVQDDEALRNLDGLILDHFGFHYAAAPDGKRGLEILEREEFDLIFIDCYMPVMDGFEMLMHIRADARWNDLPVLMSAVQKSKAFIEGLLAAGADSYVSIPFTPKELVTEIKRLLAQGRRSTGGQRNHGTG